ncbi:MAG: GNAT family N-acetyltransferase [Phycisphaerae bacterium]|nr:GNAT family N-acetyltransferase [Phycisphaerae bacterium]
MNVVIRTATEADVQTIVRFNAAMALETESKQLDEPTLTAGVYAVLHDPALGVYYLAQRGDDIVGQALITFEWSDWRNAMFWWIQSVYVAPVARRTGVYRQLYETIARCADESPNVCGLRLYVERENTTAQRTYEQLGMHRSTYQFYESTS